MKNIWEKVKNFFSRVWHDLTVVGRVILGAILLILVVMAAYALSNRTENIENENTRITQIRQPSIGEPLAPDVPGENGVTGNVGGDSTATPSDSGATTSFIAPDAGIDDSKPIKYDNSLLKFAATLPAYSQVNEQADGVKFTSNNGSLHYVVSVNNVGTENLVSIEAQLRNSPTASNIASTTIAGTKAIKFTAKGYGTGIAFIANDKIYYLLGNSQYFSDFKLL